MLTLRASITELGPSSVEQGVLLPERLLIVVANVRELRLLGHVRICFSKGQVSTPHLDKQIQKSTDLSPQG